MRYKDPCLMYLQKAECLLEGYKELSAYTMFFEAEDPEIANTMETNNKIEQKTESVLKKACQAVRTLIDKILDSIQNFFQKITMSKGDRASYEEFLKQAAENPNMKGKKITVKDWRKINAIYDESLKEIESQIKLAEQGKEEEATRKANEIIEKTKKRIAEVSSATITILGMDSARKIADSSKETAKLMKYALKDEGAVMKHLENTVGKKGAKKFKNQIESDGKLISLHRMKVWLLDKKYNSAKDCFMSTIHEVSNILDKNVDTSKKIKTITKSEMAKDAARFIDKDENPNVTLAKYAAKSAMGKAKADKKRKERKEATDNLKKFWL